MPWHWWICCQWTRVTRELITQVKTYSLCDPCGSNIIHRRRLKFSITPTRACSETFSTRTVISSFNFSSHVWIIPVDVPLQQTPTENYHRDSNPVSKVASSIQVQIVQDIKKRDDPGMEMFIQETKNCTRLLWSCPVLKDECSFHVYSHDLSSWNNMALKEFGVAFNIVQEDRSDNSSRWNSEPHRTFFSEWKCFSRIAWRFSLPQTHAFCELRFVGDPHVVSKCWVIFQILTTWITYLLNIGQCSLNLNFRAKQF